MATAVKGTALTGSLQDIFDAATDGEGNEYAVYNRTTSTGYALVTVTDNAGNAVVTDFPLAPGQSCPFRVGSTYTHLSLGKVRVKHDGSAASIDGGVSGKY